MGERSTRWLSTRWAGLISDQWCVPTRTNRDHRSLSHGHTPTVRPCQTSSNGGGRALLGANVSPADVSFRPGISVSPKRNGGAPKSNPTKLSAAVRANTRSRVRRLFSEPTTIPLTPPVLPPVPYCVLLCGTIGGSRHGELPRLSKYSIP